MNGFAVPRKRTDPRFTEGLFEGVSDALLRPTSIDHPNLLSPDSPQPPEDEEDGECADTFQEQHENSDAEYVET